ncbi:hypothetical protein NPIL_318901 [Nephila pilipes]|uniref:Uncharacterized protein n=1 Tax=Nephila pilipes TaxID=299642 RepID=A0A8X6QEA8_NEPPI|nr:hypothetical protein NPIL_318901 [Nephila pilipes]
MLLSLRYPKVKVHGKTIICMDTDYELLEECFVLRMVVSPSICQLPVHCYSLMRILTLMFPFWLQREPNMSASDSVGRTLHDPRGIQFPQIAEQVLEGLPLLKALFQSSHFSEV